MSNRYATIILIALILIFILYSYFTKDYLPIISIILGYIVGNMIGRRKKSMKGGDMSDRKFVIESKRYIGKDGKTTFDQWITSANVIEIEHEAQYLVFFPLEGDFAGKKHYIPFSNIHIVREL